MKSFFNLLFEIVWTILSTRDASKKINQEIEEVYSNED